MAVLQLLLIQLLFCCFLGLGTPAPLLGTQTLSPPSFLAKGSRAAFPLVRSEARANNHAAKIREVPESRQKDTCYIHSLYIQRPPPHNAVLRRKRNAPFHFFVRLNLVCTVAKSVKPLWKIYRVQNTTTMPDWDKPINSSSIHGVNMIRLDVPSFTLDYGLYLFYFTVEINPIWTKIFDRGSDQVYVQIEKNDLVANIAGGTYRTVGFSDNWTLDGSSSYDPDSQEGLKGITFTWYCTKEVSDYRNMKISPGKGCHPTQRDLEWLTSSGPVQKMTPEFLPGNAVYYFRLVIQKDSRRSYADQTVKVQSGSTILLDVKCLENCGSTLIPTERFTLSGKCLNCRITNQPVYYWSLLSENSTEISLDWSSRTSTGRSGPYLSIHAQTFAKAAHRAYILQLKVTTWDSRSSTYQYAFMVSSPPRAGRCTIKPHWGIAFHTLFVVQCNGFSDNNSPLTYKVIVASSIPRTTKITSVEENTFGPVVYFGYQPRTPPSFLPVGVPSQKYTLKLYVQVHDSLGTFTQVSLYVRVQNPSDRQPQTVVFNKLLASVSGVSALMASHLQTGDSLNAGYLAYLVASVLNAMKASPNLKLPKAQFRERLIQIALNISVESTMEINQVVAALSQITEEASEVSPSSQDLVTKKLAEVSAMLKVRRNESRWSEGAEIQTTGILKCLSNIMRAALLYRRNVSELGAKQVFPIMTKLVEIVFQGKVPGETETVMETKHWNVTLKKDETWNITNASSMINTCRNCFYPCLRKGNQSELLPNAVISTAIFKFEENSLSWLGNTSEIPTMVLGFTMAETKVDGQLREIMPEGAEFTLERKKKESSTFPLAIGPDKKQSYTTGGFSFEINRNAKTTYIQILTKLKVSFQVFVFSGTNITYAPPIASFTASHNRPTVTSTNETAGTDCHIKAPYIICLPESLLTATAQGNDIDTSTISIVLMTSYIVRRQNQKLVNIHIFSDQCLFQDGAQSPWRADTCKLGSLTDLERVHCICNMEWIHTSSSGHTVSSASIFKIRFLAAQVLVTPNTVDLGKILIEDIAQNLVTLLTVLCIFTIYFLLARWARKKDRADRDNKNKVIILQDSSPLNQGGFLVTLYTGSRWGAGTKADIFIQLIGQNGTSEVCCLQNLHGRYFQLGGVDVFVLISTKDLGDICSIRVWHSNKGPSASWFLSRATVQNIFSRKIWFFMCRKWLSLDKGDCFAVTDPKTPLSRLDYFLINLAKSLREDHPWVSIFANVLTDNFTRFQRVSVYLATLLFNLLADIMFFYAERNEASPRHLRVLRSIMVGIECALITLPMDIIINTLFKCSQKEPSPHGMAHSDPEEHVQKLHLSETKAQSTNISPLENLPGTSNSWSPSCSRKTIKEGPQRWQNCVVSERVANTIETEAQTMTVNPSPIAKAGLRRPLSSSNFSNYAEVEGSVQKERKPLGVIFMLFCKRLRLVFYWYSIYISWVLLITLTVISSPTIVLYGLSYGSWTSQEWLLASTTSLIEKVFVLSILKIIFFSTLRTIYPKSQENIPWLTLENSYEIQLAKEITNTDEVRALLLKLNWRQ